MVIEFSILVALVVAVVRLVRIVNKPNEQSSPKYFDESLLPLIAVAVGVILSFLANTPNSNLLFDGLIAGLSGAGLWDSGKSTVGIAKEYIDTRK